MNRNELFDKLLKQLYENNDCFWELTATSEQLFGVDDEKMIESIVDEMLDRKLVISKNYSKFSVMIKYEGQQFYEKYGSYSSFLNIENNANKRTKAEKTVNTILSIIGGICVILSCVFTYLTYEKDKIIENQKSEIQLMKKEIDSLIKITEKKNIPPASASIPLVPAKKNN